MGLEGLENLRQGILPGWGAPHDEIRHEHNPLVSSLTDVIRI